MTESASDVRDEFDRLAALPAEWGWNDFYHPRLARALPASTGRLLEAGCGTGAFARFIAPRCREVLALDLSPRMLEQARRQPVPANVRFEEADLLTADLPAGSFDAAVSIAALHHMDLEGALGRFAELLRPGGRLAILDLHRPDGPADRIAWALGALAAPPVMFVKSGRLFPSRPAHEAWAHHAIHDRFMSLAEVKERAGRVLPGCEVRRISSGATPYSGPAHSGREIVACHPRAISAPRLAIPVKSEVTDTLLETRKRAALPLLRRNGTKPRNVTSLLRREFKQRAGILNRHGLDGRNSLVSTMGGMKN